LPRLFKVLQCALATQLLAQSAVAGAFVGWTGVAPSVYRKRNKSAKEPN
jgi:hypothetical protein